MNRSINSVSAPPIVRSRSAKLPLWIPAALLPAALLWSYWPTIYALFNDWQSDDNYSVGQLVPMAALYLLWQERSALSQYRAAPSFLWGVALLILAQMVRLFGLAFLFESAERYSIVLSIAGIVLLTAGWRIFHHVRWIFLFLFLMVPLPGKIHNLISGPLQSWATGAAVFTLELIGFEVTRQGHVMVLNDTVPIAVAEACSGLRMLTAFVVVAATLAYVVNRPRWQKITLICSSVPVALLCNLLRLVVTAVLFVVASSELGERFFHDFAGITMMPIAVLLLAAELWLMSRLVIEDDK